MTISTAYRSLALIIVSYLQIGFAWAQESDTLSYRQSANPLPAPSNEFQFARLVYTYEGGYGWPRWRADWPDAEQHFNAGLDRLTNIDVASDGVLMELGDPSLFDHPWLYAVEVGFIRLSALEIANLREYLLRGGFLMVDDFHGPHEWRHFQSVMTAVFPDRPLVQVGEESALFESHFQIEELIQVPGIRSLMTGRTWEKGGISPAWHVIRDDSDRIIVVVNYNQDLGDGWEHADDPIYPQEFTGQAYKMGVNYVIYAMTH